MNHSAELGDAASSWLPVSGDCWKADAAAHLQAELMTSDPRSMELILSGPLLVVAVIKRGLALLPLAWWATEWILLPT